MSFVAHVLFVQDVYKRQALYWVTSNAYQVGQTYLLNNPFKIIAEREAKEQASRDMEKQKRRALNKAQKKKK